MKKALIIIAAILLLYPGTYLKAADESGGAVVLVAPFQIHSEERLDYMAGAIPQMLSSRLDTQEEINTLDESIAVKIISRLKIKTLDEESARRLGEEAQADWVILGAITKIGDSVSLDARLIDISAGKPTISESLQKSSLNEIIEGVGSFARKLSYKILGKVMITGIAFQGNRLVEDQAILNAMELRLGDAFSPDDIQEEIRRIYEMGYFSDIKVESADEPAGKKITFIVKENPEITEIRITGNKKVDTADVKEQMDLKLYTILNYNTVKDTAEKIKKYYQDNGYYNALVDFRTEEVSPEQAVLIFQIVEHHPMKIKKVTFVGNEKIKSRKIRRVMETRKKTLLSFLTKAGTFKEDGLRMDLDRIRAFYYDHGFLDIQVGEPDVTHDEKWFYIKIPLQEGEPYRINEVNIAGDIIETEEPLEKQIKVKTGERFSREKIHEDIMALTDVYGGFGYAFADIAPLTKVNADDKTVGLTYDIAKGEEVYFETINITGNTKTRDKIIRRELRVEEGGLYNNKKLQKSRERLNNLGYFEDVKINTQKGSEPDKMNLEVNVKEKPTGMISAGAGYSSVDNLVGIFQLSQQNFLGKGLDATIMAQIGGNNRYRLAITEPYLFDRNIAAGFDIYNIDLEYEDFDSDSQGLGLNFGFLPFGKDREEYRLSFSYNFSVVDISDLALWGRYNVPLPDPPPDPLPPYDYYEYDADLDLIEAEEDSPFTISSITSALSRDTVDDRFYPMRGSAGSLSLEIAGLGGEKFYKGIFDGRKYFPLFWETAFMARASAGYARGYGGDELPVFERFFLGGLDSLRGFEYRSVGPKGEPGILPNGIRYSGDAVIGGNKMMLFNFEYLFPIIKAAKIRGLFFFDMGNAFADDESFEFDLRESMGIGVNWNSPFGPLRVVWGINLDPEDDEDSSQFEFSVGTGF